MAPPAGTEASWSLLATDEDIVDVSGSSSTDVYALGSKGTLFHYDGKVWTVSLALSSAEFQQWAGYCYWSKIWYASPVDIFLVGISSHVENHTPVSRASIYHWDGSELTLQVSEIPTWEVDLWGSSKDDMYAVGQRGMILHYDGSAWKTVSSGITEDVRAVWGVSENDIFIALKNSILSYDGDSWSELTTSTAELYDLWASSSEDVYAVGRNGVVLHYDGESWSSTVLDRSPNLEAIWGISKDEVYVAGEKYVFRFDGNDWTSARFMDRYVYSLWGSASNDVFAVGSGDGDYHHGPLIAHFDGLAWNTEAKEYYLDLSGVFAISGNDHEIYVGGGYSTLLRYDGVSWRELTGSDGGRITDIWPCPDPSASCTRYGVFYAEDMAVWGSGSGDVFMVGANGRIERLSGTHFETMDSPTSAELYDVWGRSSNEIYAVGEDGTIVGYDGQMWHTMGSHTSEDLYAMWGEDESLFVVGAGGTILRYRNFEWEPMNSSTTASLTGIWGDSEKELFAVGKNVLLHYDGSRWRVKSDMLGGTRVWGRSSDEVYVIDGDRILRYGTTQGRAVR